MGTCRNRASVMSSIALLATASTRMRESTGNARAAFFLAQRIYLCPV
jgi:hypothetical protein